MNNNGLVPRSVTVPAASGPLLGVFLTVGILSIVADTVTISSDSYLGILGSTSSGFGFAPLLWPFNLPMLNITGIVLGLATITSAFASETGACVVASIGSGFALTLSTSLGTLTFAHSNIGWPLAWAHLLDTLGTPYSKPMFYLDMTGLLVDLAFWAGAAGLALSLLRLYLHEGTNLPGDDRQHKGARVASYKNGKGLQIAG